jgi:lipoprotein-anchoring transpeptidase ErfK/SrfK
MLKFLLGAALVPAVLIGMSVAYMLADDEADSTTQAPSAPPVFRVGPDVGPATEASAPAPAATVLADRTSCAEIAGTDYRSDSERAWYIETCVPTPVPTRAVPAPDPPAIPGPEVVGERWILVDIASQTTTAMIGDRPLYTALATTGKEGWETPPGNYKIVRRVQNETMTSVSIGAEEFYELKDVLYTQYFTTAGHALHLNYWRPDYYFGSIPSSHGCVGLRLADAEFFWKFATGGTRVTVR